MWPIAATGESVAAASVGGEGSDGIPTAREYPPDGAEIQWLGSDGTPTDGVMVGRLWFFADGSMYIYYWRWREGA